MEKNIGKIDRIIRFILGIVVVYIAFSIQSNALIRILLLAIALISIIESFTGSCGLYKLFKINTIKNK